MKATFILCLALLTGKVSFAQQAPSIPSNALYVISTDDKVFITDKNGISLDEHIPTSKDAMIVDPHWIKSITVIKGQSAIDQYGDKGKNGVVVFNLEQEGFNHLSSRDQARFKKK